MAIYYTEDGKTIKLMAAADQDSTFVQWSGDAVGNENPILLTVDGDKIINGQFDSNPPPPPPEPVIRTVEVLPIGSGTGTITVEEVGVYPSPTIAASDVVATAGDQISVSIYVKDFLRIGAITLKINYNPNVLTWIGANNWNNQMINTTDSANAVNGVVVVAWDRLNGVDIADDKLVDLNFSYNGENSVFNFITQQCEIANTDAPPKILSVNYVNGSVTPVPSNNYNWTVPETYPTIYDVPFSQLSGTVGKIGGTFDRSWQMQNANNLAVHFENFVLQGAGLRIDDCSGLTLRGLGDYNDFMVRDYDDKHIRIDRCTNLELDSVFVVTPPTGGQTDCIYCQNTSGFVVRKSRLEIWNDGGGHNDCVQMYRVGGEVLIEENILEQNNDKTTDNQGIYATTTDRGGRFRYLNNHIGGRNSSGGRSNIKNCLTVRVLPDLGGKPVPVEIRGNVVESDGYNYVYLTGITDYNSDIRTVNNFEKTSLGVAGVNIS